MKEFKALQTSSLRARLFSKGPAGDHTQLCQLPLWMVMNTRESASSAGESLQIQQDPLPAQLSLLTLPSLTEIFGI